MHRIVLRLAPCSFLPLPWLGRLLWRVLSAFALGVLPPLPHGSGQLHLVQLARDARSTASNAGQRAGSLHYAVTAAGKSLLFGSPRRHPCCLTRDYPHKVAQGPWRNGARPFLTLVVLAISRPARGGIACVVRESARARCACTTAARRPHTYTLSPSFCLHTHTHTGTHTHTHTAPLVCASPRPVQPAGSRGGRCPGLRVAVCLPPV